MNLTYAQKVNPAHEGMKLPDRYNEYVVKADGVVFGTIKWTYRPKNAGGSAWAAYFNPKADGEIHNGQHVIYNKDRRKLLTELRSRVAPAQKVAA